MRRKNNVFSIQMKKGRREVAFLFVSHYGGQVQKKAAPTERLFCLRLNRFLVLSLDVVHTDLDGLHVQRDELVGALRQAVTQTLFDILVVDDGAS